MSAGVSPDRLDQALSVAPSLTVTFSREWQLDAYRSQLYRRNAQRGSSYRTLRRGLALTIYRID